MRISVLVPVMLLFAPLVAVAQTAPAATFGRFSVSVFTGARVPFTTGSVVIYADDGTPLLAAREQRGGNPVVGAEAAMGVGRGFSALAGVTYSRTGNGEFFFDRPPTFGERGDYFVRYLSNSWFAKAGISFRATGSDSPVDGRRRPSTDVYAAGALVRQFDDNHPAVNVGFRGSLPVSGGSVEMTLGVEDYFVFWNEDALDRTMLEVLGPIRTGSAAAEMFYDTSHIFVLRLGASLRL